MANYQSAAKLLLAQNVKLYADLGASSNDDETLGSRATPSAAAADDYIASMTVLDWSIVHPMNRSNHGRKVDYGFAAPDILISAVFSGTSAIVPILVDLCHQDEVGVIESRAWKFTAEDLGRGSADKTVTAWADVIVYELRGSKVDAHPGQPVTMEATMIVRDPTGGGNFDALNVTVGE